MNNHKESIRHNHKGLSMAVHRNQTGNSINDTTCAILNENFATVADRRLYEQKLIQKFDDQVVDDFGLLFTNTSFKEIYHFVRYA